MEDGAPLMSRNGGEDPALTSRDGKENPGDEIGVALCTQR